MSPIAMTTRGISTITQASSLKEFLNRTIRCSSRR